MSKLGKKPILIPAEITAREEEGFLRLKGPKGELKLKILPNLNLELAKEAIKINPTSQTKQAIANWGTMSALLKNALKGLSEKFSKTLLIEGVGFRAAIEGKDLVLYLGFTQPIKYKIPEEIEIAVEKNTTIKVSGIDKEKVGEAAAEIRAFKKPEPYKGKGIRYENEIVRRKAGKKVAGVGAAAAA